MLLAGLTQRLKSRARDRERDRGRRTAGSQAVTGMMQSARMRREREHARNVMEREGRQKLNPDAKPFVFDPDATEASENDDVEDDPIQKKYLGRRLYSRVYSVQGAVWHVRFFSFCKTLRVRNHFFQRFSNCLVLATDLGLIAF